MTKGTIKGEFQELRSILNEWDFLSVLPGEGGPEDEYEDLVSMTLSFLYNLNSDFKNTSWDERQIMLNKFLVNTIKGHFGMTEYAANYPERIEEYADKILEWWKALKNKQQ